MSPSIDLRTRLQLSTGPVLHVKIRISALCIPYVKWWLSRRERLGQDTQRKYVHRDPASRSRLQIFSARDKFYCDRDD